MRKILIIVGTLLVTLLLLLGACAPASEPKPFPPPEGYSSWDEYYEEYYKETGPPAPPPASQLTSSEQSYAVTIADHAFKVSNAMYNLGDLMENPQIGDDEWTLQVAAQLATIRLLYDEAMEIDPPSSMATIHNKYMQAMSHFEAATHLIAQGIDELDPDLINQATEELLIGSQLVNEATQLIDEFTEAHSK